MLTKATHLYIITTNHQNSIDVTIITNVMDKDGAQCGDGVKDKLDPLKIVPINIMRH